MAAIELDGVSKSFDAVTALQGVDLTVREGEIFGFLGPNGAGKSTTINVLLDFVRPTEGTATVLGYDAQAQSQQVRQRTGVLPEGFDVYDRLTGRQHVAFAAESKGVDADADHLLGRVGLREAGTRPAGNYSKGMQQRLALAMALVGDPDLLILDEPTTGLDPNGARELRSLIREENERGATVFFSSHILAQVEAVCDRVGILREGEVEAVNTVDALRDQASADSRLQVSVGALPDRALSATRALEGVSAVTPSEDGIVTITCANRAKLAALNALADNGAVVEDFVTDEASLEDLFVEYTTEDDAPGEGTPPQAGDTAGPSTNGDSHGAAGGDTGGERGDEQETVDEGGEHA
jgi:ABC-2 type transport system ATP-binding protein